MNRKVCPKCGTTLQEILETGFVGCEQCYKLPQVQLIVDKLFDGKTHKEG